MCLANSSTATLHEVVRLQIWLDGVGWSMRGTLDAEREKKYTSKRPASRYDAQEIRENNTMQRDTP
jgi:hypothetical protein